ASSELLGDVIVAVSKSCDPIARLSVKKWLPHDRRAHVSSTDTRGATSCCTVTLYCQSYGRMPQPCIVSGLTIVAPNGLPKFRFVHGPQTSPPAAELSSAVLLVSTQSTRKFLFESVHDRFVVCWNVTAGLPIVYCASLFAACRYLLTFTFTDVLPLPKTSYATPILG